MDAGMERPELRTFKGDPVQTVLHDRHTYAAHALTILRAFHVAGRPMTPGTRALAGFDDWHGLVRGALLWLGQADPLKQQRGAEQSGERQELAELYEVIEEKIGLDRVFQAGELTKLANRGDTELSDKIEAVCGTVKPGPLGRKLSQYNGTIIRGYQVKMLCQGENSKASRRFKLRKL